jgi:hypothetical protein
VPRGRRLRRLHHRISDGNKISHGQPLSCVVVLAL